MWKYPVDYDVIVVGGGHAGCEAASAAARMGARTLLLTMNNDTIAKLSCNPAIGGIGKGHMVREIDALGGEMGQITDQTGIQFRMLNATNGPAVWAPRAQVDKNAYQQAMKHRLEQIENLTISQGTVESINLDGAAVRSITTKEGIEYHGKTLVLSSGTFMRGLLHIGETNFEGGRAGDAAARGLSPRLEHLGLKLGRLKTGTPPRVNARSIDYSQTEEQPGDHDVFFSYRSTSHPLKQVSCHITYTTAETKKIIQNNLHRSPMYSGKIKSIGPRYCPSIEDKIVRFADKERHQIFLEPEGLTTEEVYVNGVSSSLPFDVQLEFIHSVPALRNAQITRPAYAIEYDYIESGQIFPSLETKAIEGLYIAGQLNGTTGYEEAAAQGLMAGMNAARKVQGKSPIILSRSEAYIGVMIDDLVTKSIDEPYRMFTSRAEHRLLLRQDNADQRLRHYGYENGLVSKQEMQNTLDKMETIERVCKQMERTFVDVEGKGFSLSQLLKRPENTYQSLVLTYSKMEALDPEIARQIELNVKYSGYIERQKEEVKRFSHMENIPIPKHFKFKEVNGLRNEAAQKLTHYAPTTLGQASRISGVSPADISILMISLKR